MTKPTTGAAIIRLLLLCGPSTVVWGVGSIVVDAINTVTLGWSLPHVGIEGSKVIPSITNSDASAPVIGICPIAWPHASSPHIHPDTILWDFVGQPMCSVDVGLKFCFQAPTAFGVARKQLIPSDEGCMPTVTQAEPSPVMSDMTGQFYDQQSVEALAGYVYGSHPGSIQENLCGGGDVVGRSI